jgi:glutathione S-transferase
MKLCYAPAVCSFAVHIVAREAELPISLEKVDLTTHKTEAGTDLYTINPKGYVPAIELDSGEILTEVSAILQFLPDQASPSPLVPACGTIDRIRLQEWLTFISSEIHKGFGPLWDPGTPLEMKQITKKKLGVRFAYLDEKLAGRTYLMGEQFTVVDAYLFTVVNWVNFLDMDISAYQNLKAFQERIASRPKVREALKAEGLLKAAA